MFNFPSSPTPGQSYIPVVGGPAYSWDGTVWRLTAGGISAGVYIGDTPPVNPPQGMLWFESDSGNTYIWFDDGTSAQWVQFNALATNAVVSTAQPRNRIVNPAFQISQENPRSTSYATVNTYIADQWTVYFVTGGTPVFAIHNVYHPADADEPNATWMRFNSTVADAAIAVGDYYTMRQTIEGTRIADFGWGTAAAKPAVLRFRAYSSIAGTFCVSLRSPSNDSTFVKDCTIAAGETKTFVIPIPPTTTGTWPTDTSAGLHLNFTVMSGTSLNGGTDNQWGSGGFVATPQISNWLSVSGQYLDITNIGLYLDPDGTGLAPEWETPDEAEELRACQRYYEVVSDKVGVANAAIGTMSVTTATSGRLQTQPFKVDKRTQPTVAITGNVSMIFGGTATSLSFSIDHVTKSEWGASVVMTGGTAGQASLLRYDAGGGRIIANARM